MTLWFCAPADLGSILPPVFPTARDVRGGNHLIAVVASRGRGRSDRGRPGWLSPRDPASLQPHLLAGTGEQTFTRAERFPAARRHAHGGEIVRRLSVFVDVASVAAGNAQTAPIPPREAHRHEIDPTNWRIGQRTIWEPLQVAICAICGAAGMNSPHPCPSCEAGDTRSTAPPAQSARRSGDRGRFVARRGRAGIR